MESTPITPLEYILTHLQVIGWPAVVVIAYKASRLFTKATVAMEDGVTKFNEVHKTITNDMQHEIKEAVDLMKKQDTRWEQWMTLKAAQKGE